MRESLISKVVGENLAFSKLYEQVTPPQKLKPIPTSYFMYLKTLSDGRG